MASLEPVAPVGGGVKRQEADVFDASNAYNSCQCDESRPSCVRCTKANIVCTGYRNESDVIFRRGLPSNKKALSRTCASGAASTTLWTSEVFLQRFQDVQIKQCALSAFFRNYTVSSTDVSLSHGYLAGLEALLTHAKPESEIFQASNIIALASLGNRLNIAPLLHKARWLYLELLRSFHTTLPRLALKNVVQPFTTAVLLGLYELITADPANPCNHIAHARGISAMLSTERSPVDFSVPGILFQVANALWLHEPGKFQPPGSCAMLCTPISDNPHLKTNNVFAEIHAVLQNVETMLSDKLTLSDDLHRVLQEVILLDKEYSKVLLRQPDESRPRRIHPKIASSLSYPGWWPEEVDIYFDLYAAATWNIYRKTRLMLLDVIIRCLSRLQIKDAYGQKQAEATEIANDIMTSIPFHVTDNVEGVVEQMNAGIVHVPPGKAVGGLLLMHPLFVASNLSVVPQRLQARMRECLAWIGEHMGIGQATVFSKTSTTFPNDSTVHGLVLLWAGMLIRPR